MWTDYASRFRALGRNRVSAWRSAASPSIRNALVQSRIELLPGFLRGGNLSRVIDVGANYGQWITAFLQFSQSRRVDVFEPNPAAFEVLSSRLATLDCAVLHNVALGSCNTQMELNVMSSSDLSSLLPSSKRLEELYGAGSARTKTLSVGVRQLDDFIGDSDSVDLLKIDVQGFERQVLRGASETLKRTRVILIELNFQAHYEGEDSFVDLSNLLVKELGFEFWDMSLPARGPDHRATWADGVFLSPDAVAQAGCTGMEFAPRTVRV